MNVQRRPKEDSPVVAKERPVAYASAAELFTLAANSENNAAAQSVKERRKRIGGIPIVT